ncbi:MAG: histidine phosphatase family protein [Pseudomonadota bacterium]
MSRTLILMRHAKSSWSDASIDDFDRPLNNRGRKSSTALGAWLAARDLVPQEVLVSGARRTVETWQGIATHMPAQALMRSEPALYLAAAETIVATLRQATAPIVLLIGHNPGIGACAAQLVETAPEHEKFDQYPTGATTVMQFAGADWRSVSARQGQLLEFVVPRELT